MGHTADRRSSRRNVNVKKTSDAWTRSSSVFKSRGTQRAHTRDMFKSSDNTRCIDDWSHLIRKGTLALCSLKSFKSVCPATQKGQECGSLSEASTNCLYYVSKQWRFWRNCADVCLCDKYHFLMCRLIYKNRHYGNFRQVCLLSFITSLTVSTAFWPSILSVFLIFFHSSRKFHVPLVYKCSSHIFIIRRGLHFPVDVHWGHSYWITVLCAASKRPRGRAVSAPDFGSRGRGFESRWRRDSSRT